MNFRNFDAVTVDLEGSNLIEASAGTGKTYSIALMVLRLVLEKQVSVREILMVTFTKAAVAELEERIRLFIRQAHKVSLGFKIGDPTITGLVRLAIDRTSVDAVQTRLNDSVLFLDETAVLTIHSFCQQTLTEFAFETNQLFGSDTLKDIATLIESEVNKFWRSHVTTMNLNLLGQLIDHGFCRQDIVSVIREHISGKKYFEYDADSDYFICDEDQETFSKKIRELDAKDIEIKECVYQSVRSDRSRLRSITEGNRFAKSSLLHLVDTPAEFVKQLVGKKGTGYIEKLYGDILTQHAECDELVDEKNTILQSVINKLYCRAIGTVEKAIERYKQLNSLIGFDDMIVNLHKAVVHDKNQNLIQALQKKYKAVFVDEFQDTDKLQYEVFRSTFGGGANVLFYIGDPKQSIYAWRKADIYTYFKASGEVNNRYGMNVNHRSSDHFIQAMNQFFKPYPGFDTFYFGGKEHSIDYINVASPPENRKGRFLLNGQPDVPISIYQNKDNAEIAETVTAQVINLLENKAYGIEEKGICRTIRPSDISILVRKNKQAIAMKACLAKRGIPAVTIDDTRILQSQEAVYVLYILEALIEVNRAAINKALLSPFTGYDTKAVLSLNEEVVLNEFREYKNIWDKDGVYSALMKFVGDYQVVLLLLNHRTENGERTIANLFQVIEVLHKVQSEKQLSALELVSWLQRGIDGMQTEGDEFEQRVESDEEAVKIVTLHKSKGLEYNIVFAPYLDLDTKIHFRFCSFRDNETGDYFFADTDQLSQDQQKMVDEQLEQENRRLIYVAITRAVYKCYLNKSMANYFKDSSLVPFVTAAASGDPSLICFQDCPSIPERYFYRRQLPIALAKDHTPVNFHLAQVHWRKMSYSALAANHQHTTRVETVVAQSGYDHFIFRQLARGTKTGNMLHYIFENIDFANNNYWNHTIKEGLRRFLPKHADEYKSELSDLLSHLSQATIAVGEQKFSLSEISENKRLNELEFDFNVPRFNLSQLQSHEQITSLISLKYSDPVEGIMNGKMDLFFEHKGKYFILDWKSNYLGDTVEDYRSELLNGVMTENNYHLQYLLYTIAAKKYLASRLPGFEYNRHFGGVIYLFVRGVRAQSESGVFTCRPDLTTINWLENLMSFEAEATSSTSARNH